MVILKLKRKRERKREREITEADREQDGISRAGMWKRGKEVIKQGGANKEEKESERTLGLGRK